MSFAAGDAWRVSIEDPNVNPQDFEVQVTRHGLAVGPGGTANTQYEAGFATAGGRPAGFLYDTKSKDMSIYVSTTSEEYPQVYCRARWVQSRWEGRTQYYANKEVRRPEFTGTCTALKR